MTMSRPKHEESWLQFGTRLLINAACHPIEYAKVLIQIGHEPIPPYPTETLFGRPALALPNVFQYLSYIKSVDGFVGCYRGLGPKLCGHAVSALVFSKVSKSLWSPEERDGDSNDDNDDEPVEEKGRKCIKSTLREGTAKTVAYIVSQPFNVIAIRMMAQFVGGEHKYIGIFGSIKAVYKENGITGFFSGLVPKIIGEMSALALASAAIFFVTNFVVEDRDVKKYVAVSIRYFTAAVTYPFQTVSTCMVVTNSGILAGQPPNMPIYTSWIDCWSHLQRTNQLKRGSSIIWRYYAGPQIIINGQTVAINKNFVAAGAM